MRVVPVAVALALAAGAAAAAWPAAPESEVIRVDALPWHRAAAPAPAAPPARPPIALLYVLPSCPHCEEVVRTADAEAARRGLDLRVIAGDRAEDANAWAMRVRLRAPLVHDSASALRRALLVRYVPTLVVVRTDGRAERLVGDRGPNATRSFLRALP